MESSDNTLSFFARLKQHHIYRVVVVYAVACWVLLQLGNSLFPDFGLPGYDVRYLIVVLLLGFPVVLVLAWVFLKPKDPVKYTRWQKLRWKLGSVLAFVVLVLVVISGVFTWRASIRHAERLAVQQAAAQTATAFNPPIDSIVVLPFTNLSNDPNQQYFSDGITEELTGALGQNTGLTVIAWDTASKFRDTQQTASEMGRTLNVAHILDGSIEREGAQVRVSVELVSTITGQQLWSAHYDDSFRNIFAVQDKISAAIADALKVKFAGMQGEPTLNPEAHDLYLKGLVALDRATAVDAQAAQDYFQQALKLDPNYADAWAGLAETYVWQSVFSTLPLKEALPEVRAAARKALALDPRNVNALVALGSADLNDHRIVEAREKFAQALEYDPSNSAAHQRYGLVLPLKPAVAQFEEAVRLDPDNAIAQSTLSVYYGDLSDWFRMASAAQALNKLAPNNTDGAFMLAFAYTQMRRGEEAVEAFDLVQPATPIDEQLIAAGRLTYRALLIPDLRPRAQAMLDLLSQAGNSPVERIDLAQLFLALGEMEQALKMLQEFCPASPVGCNDLAINPMYAPLHGDPRFERLSKQYTTVTLQ